MRNELLTMLLLCFVPLMGATSQGTSDTARLELQDNCRTIDSNKMQLRVMDAQIRYADSLNTIKP